MESKSNDIAARIGGMAKIARAIALVTPVLVGSLIAGNAAAIDSCGACVAPPPSDHPSIGSSPCAACHTVKTPPPVVNPPPVVTPRPVVTPPSNGGHNDKDKSDRKDKKESKEKNDSKKSKDKSHDD